MNIQGMEFIVSVGLLVLLLAAWCVFLIKRNRQLVDRLDRVNEVHQQQSLLMERVQVDLENTQSNMKDLLENNALLTEQLKKVSADFHESEKQAHAKEAELKSLDRIRHDQEQNVVRLQNEVSDLKHNNAELHTQQATLKVSLKERDERYQEQVARFEEQKKALEKEFENLANRIFDEKGKAFSASNKESIEHLLKPFREQITEFRQRVDHIQKENSESTGSLRAELSRLRDLNQKMTADAQNLTEALKGDKKKVGSWGEIQLERTLQIAGLMKGDHYESQAHFKDQDGKNNYPDFVVKLPDEKHIVIDSKVSLIDYDAAISASNEDEEVSAMDKHCKAVKQHIDTLSSKDYSNLIGMKSPSFVLMFMPIEPAYIEAMRHNKELFNYGYQKGVILVSHTTLMPILRTVANLWMIERSNSEAKAISDKAGEIYNQVCVMADRMKNLGGSLMQASKHYNSVVVGLVGQQGLYGKVERFSQLSNKISKTMPNLETAHLDIEVDRLEVISEDAQQELEQAAGDTDKV